MILFANVQFWFYTKLINHYIRKNDFDQVAIYLEKKKQLAKIIRKTLTRNETAHNRNH